MEEHASVKPSSAKARPVSAVRTSSFFTQLCVSRSKHKYKMKAGV
jgi:hypothetical protein